MSESNPSQNQSGHNHRGGNHFRGRGNFHQRGRGNFHQRGRGGPFHSRRSHTAVTNVDGNEVDQFLSQANVQSDLPKMGSIPFTQLITGPNANSIVQALSDMDIYQPSLIQAQAISHLNPDQHDGLIAQGPNGSGKTIAFLVSMLLHVNNDIHAPQTICLAHTRELSIQNFEIFSQLNQYTQFKASLCLKDYENPAADAQLLFGTPSSVVFFVRQNIIDISKVNLLIIDEADKILESHGNLAKSTFVLIKSLLPRDCQLGLFSATYPKYITDTIQKLRRNIFSIRLKRRDQHVRTVTHVYTRVQNNDEAYKTILELTKHRAHGLQTFIFAPTKQEAHNLTQYLNQNDLSCKAFGADMPAEERDKILPAFKNQQFLVLVTSDILSRGIDIPQTYLVINYGLPDSKRFQQDCDTYLHRAGRAGRFGRTGVCFTIVRNQQEEKLLKDFCSNNGLQIELKFVESTNLQALPKETDAPNEEEEQYEIRIIKEEREEGAPQQTT